MLYACSVRLSQTTSTKSCASFVSSSRRIRFCKTDPMRQPSRILSADGLHIFVLEPDNGVVATAT